MARRGASPMTLIGRALVAAVERVTKRLGRKVRALYVGDDQAAAPDAQPFEDVVSDAPADEPDVARDEADLSLIFFTSGTTGRPKGVPRTQRAEYAAALANLVQHPWRLHERALGVMPLYHTMGVRTLLSMVCLSGAFVILRDWTAEEALALCERERVSALFLVPTMYQMMLRSPEFDRSDLSSIDHVSYA